MNFALAKIVSFTCDCHEEKGVRPVRHDSVIQGRGVGEQIFEAKSDPPMRTRNKTSPFQRYRSQRISPILLEALLQALAENEKQSGPSLSRKQHDTLQSTGK